MTSAFNFPYKTEPQLSLCRFSEDGDTSVTCHDEPWLELESADLWRQFDRLTTEMVITKSGRRLFPAIKVKVHDLDPSGKFVFVLDIVPVDNLRYKFQESRWTVAGPACSGRSCLEDDVTTCTSCNCRGIHQHIPDVSLPRLTCAATVPIYYVHPDSPASGQQWMSKAVSFHRLKLTNSGISNQHGHVVLSSMRRYQPRIHLFQLDEQLASCRDQLRLVKTFIFLETQFIAVTAYQNNKITRLKIDNNPFAKGFRENDKDNERQLTKNFPNPDYANLQSYNYDGVNVPTFRPHRVNIVHNCRQTDDVVKNTPQVLSALVSFFDNDVTNNACDSRKRGDLRGQIVRPRPLRLSSVISSSYRHSVSPRFCSSLGISNTDDISYPEFIYRIDAETRGNVYESVMQTRLSDRRQDAKGQSESRDPHDLSDAPCGHSERTSTTSCYSGGPIRPVPLRIRSTPYQS